MWNSINVILNWTKNKCFLNLKLKLIRLKNVNTYLHFIKLSQYLDSVYG